MADFFGGDVTAARPVDVEVIRVDLLWIPSLNISFVIFHVQLSRTEHVRDRGAGEGGRPEQDVWGVDVVQDDGRLVESLVADGDIENPAIFFVDFFKSQVLSVVPNKVLHFIHVGNRFVLKSQLQAV